MMWAISEKKNRAAIHGFFDTLERAERHLREVVPSYVRRGYYTDKTLKPEDFRIVEWVRPDGGAVKGGAK